jgi:hypothetical protein
MPRLIIDSASRNPTLFPDADRYEVELPYAMKNVASLTLLKTDVTFADTLIGLGQDRLVMDGVDGVREIAIRHEDHTGAASLAVSLQAALDSQYPTAMIAVSVVNGDRLQLASSTPFSASDTGPVMTDVMGRPVPASVVNTAARVLGLAAQVEARAAWDGVEYTVTFPHPVSLVNERYMVLNIAGVTGIDSPAPHVHGAVGIVDPGLHAIKEPFFAELNPRRTLHKLRVSLTRPNGSRYNFRGRDHRLELQIT